MQYIDIEAYIIGENFKFERELKGYSRAQLAQKVCCSVQQIQQIEDGGKSYFYTEAQKLKTAKKLAQFLEMSEEKAFLGIAPEIKNDLKVGNLPISEKPAFQGISLGGKLGFGVLSILILGFGMYELGMPDKNLYESTSVKSSQLANLVISEQIIKSDQDSIVQETQNPESDPCKIQVSSSTTFKSDKPSMAGNFVVLQSSSPHKICLVDGKGVKQVVEILPGTRKLVGGEGPFQLIGNQLNDIEIYYQGSKVASVGQGLQQIELKEIPFQNGIETIKTLVVSQNVENMNGSSQENTNLSIVKNTVNNENTFISTVTSEVKSNANISPTSDE